MLELVLDDHWGSQVKKAAKKAARRVKSYFASSTNSASYFSSREHNEVHELSVQVVSRPRSLICSDSSTCSSIQLLGHEHS